MSLSSVLVREKEKKKDQAASEKSRTACITLSLFSSWCVKSLNWLHGLIKTTSSATYPLTGVAWPLNLLGDAFGFSLVIVEVLCRVTRIIVSRLSSRYI